MKAELERARTESHDKIRLLEEKLATTQTELNTIVTQKAELDKEHEDLLVMLTEQDAKVMKYKVFSRIYSDFHSHCHGQNFWWNHGVGFRVHFILYFIFKTSLLHLTLEKQSKGVVVESGRKRKKRAKAKAFLSKGTPTGSRTFFLKACFDAVKCTVKPRYNEPLYNEVLDVMNDFLYPSNSKIYGKEPLDTSLYRGSTVLTVYS